MRGITSISSKRLDGPLQITPRQEIEFLQRLERNDLPFSKRTTDLAKDIMIMEQAPDYVLRGKTGWVTEVSPGVGWLVGYLEQNKLALRLQQHQE